MFLRGEIWGQLDMDVLFEMRIVKWCGWWLGRWEVVILQRLNVLRSSCRFAGIKEASRHWGMLGGGWLKGVIVGWGLGKGEGSWHWANYIWEIRGLLSDLDASLYHVPRSQNDMVDRLARWGVGISDCFKGNYMLAA